MTASFIRIAGKFQIESLGIVAEETFLADDLLRQLMSVGEVDLLVGVSAFAAPDAVASTVQA
ncbi:MAG: hypothetical protein WBR26_06895, partial [Candidatus Acidiferrum sp.]